MDVMSSIDFLQIGHGQQSDARMVVERGMTDSQRIELAAVHRHLFYAVYWVHEGQGTHSIDFPFGRICNPISLVVKIAKIPIIAKDSL